MESFISNDGTVAKYVHDDGSETAIKTLPEGAESCGGSNRRKFNVFISCSSGCPVGCAFCYLTVKRYPFFDLTERQIADNVVAAVKAEFNRRPEIKKLPINLSWMSMGDAWFDLKKVHHAIELILHQLDPDLVEIEGVDIGTTLPQVTYTDIIYLKRIDRALKTSGKLTSKPAERTSVRIFYSLHSVIDSVRKKLVPNSLPLSIAQNFLRLLQFNIICHCLFIEGINDTELCVSSLGRVFSSKDTPGQLRFLRFNKCPGSFFSESSKFDDIVKKYTDQQSDFFIRDLKVQVSPGSEISAACGQFLMRSSL